MTVETRPFDPAAYLDSPEAMLAYLDGAFADGDAAEIADALGVVARARPAPSS
jgi:probable addiction module antidote protein